MGKQLRRKRTYYLTAIQILIAAKCLLFNTKLKVGTMQEHPQQFAKIEMKQYVHNTDGLTKEDFNAKLPQKTDRKFIMSQILELYELDLATLRNTSLSHFDTQMKKEPA